MLKKETITPGKYPFTLEEIERIRRRAIKRRDDTLWKVSLGFVYVLAGICWLALN